MDRKESCSNCRWCVRVQAVTEGICFRCPPVPVGTHNPLGQPVIQCLQPMVRLDHFCGEWKPRLELASNEEEEYGF